MSRDIERQRAVWDTYYRKAHSSARVYNSANISIATSGASQALTFNSERWDDASYHDTSSNTSRLTAPQPGRYHIGGGVRFASNATGLRVLSVRLNGATILAIITVDAVASNVTDLAISTIYELAAGDYVELVVVQTSGGALNATAAGNYSPEFWITLC